MSVHVLVPLDPSAYSAAAGKLAVQIAKAQPSRITALRVVHVRPASGNVVDDLPGHLGVEPVIVPPEVAQERVEDAKTLVDAWAAAARAQGVEVEAVVEVGVAADTIRRHAEAADLVVMGLGGPMGGWLSQRVDTPIMWATPGADHIDAIAVGYDGSVGAKHAIRAIRHLLAPLKVPVHAFFVSRDGSGGEVLDEVQAELPDLQVHEHVVHGGSPHDALVEQAEAVGAQVLVLGFRGKHPVRDFLFGSGTERILLGSRLAVLVAR